jgi:hypothetical protein
MPTPPGDAPFSITAEQIQALAVLYDRFTNPLDPFDPTQEAHESAFNREVARLYDASGLESATFHAFRFEVIKRCRAHLRASGKFPSI